MMVPRAFSYSSGQDSYGPIQEKKMKRPSLGRAGIMTGKAVSASPASVPTKPVGIPQRGPGPLRHSEPGSDSRGQHGRPFGHDPTSMRPSVAALLAMTTIPPPKRHQISRSKKPPTPRSVSIDELIRDWRSDEPSASPSLGGDSPLSILLEPLDGQENDEESPLSSEDHELELSRNRSASSDSIPSLTADETSLLSSSNPSTPDGARTARLFDRKAKSFSLPESESCELDHPLLYFPDSPDEDGFLTESTPTPSLPTSRPSSPPTRTSTFKSNLTASLLALKSAAKSFSNFTAPSLPSDDLLTRSIIFPRFAPEMRPKPVSGVPDPAFRRYLNPSNPPLQPESTRSQHRHISTASSVHHEAAILYSATTPSTPDPSSPANLTAPMIQMHTYHSNLPTPARACSSSASGPSTSLATEASRILASASPFSSDDGDDGVTPVLPPVVRPREPRENSDFLRVVVLEMNMRRVGKLDAGKAGRARIWLPPRRMVGGAEEGMVMGEGRVPARWIGVIA
ncbi:MAG: hypothetical protein M1821_000370 [Bathelium mastoideum]|nr:MAG: hypothetical protein M1821_000370 [Bathelium mastoideum]